MAMQSERPGKMPIHRTRRILKPEAPLFEDDFDIFCADLSFACPGFAVLRYHSDIRKVELLAKSHLARSYFASGGNYPGEILNAINNEMDEYLGNQHIRIAVREQPFVSSNHATEMIYRVVGCTELLLWQRKKMPFFEVSATHVKKVITGFGNADKYQVRDGLDKYIGRFTYNSNDESDAVGVGITWLVDNYYLDNLTETERKDKFDYEGECFG